MMYKTSFILILGILNIVLGFQCDVKELEKFNFPSIKGVHSVDTSKDTPPSKTKISWHIGICDTVGVKECDGSELCEVTEIEVDKKSVILEVIKADGDSNKVSYKEFSNEDSNNENGIIISYKDIEWGSNKVNADLKFICPKEDEEDESDLDKLVLDKWEKFLAKLSMKTKAACINSKDKSPKKSEDGESWGWFTWIFIFFVLFLSIYIIGGAWFQYNKGNSIDFQTALREVLDNFIEVVKGLPIFIKEIVEKFTGNSNRGEYSAV